jgi:hypothetical protein
MTARYLPLPSFRVAYPGSSWQILSGPTACKYSHTPSLSAARKLSLAATWINRLYGEVILIAANGIVLALHLLLRQNSPQSSEKLLDKLDKFYELYSTMQLRCNSTRERD